MKSIIIIGARMDGQAGVVKDCLELTGEFKITGFLDNTPALRNSRVEGIPVLGSSAEIADRDFEADYFHIAIGDNMARAAIFDQLRKRNHKVLTLIHPLSFISKNARIGEGCFIGPMAVINSGSLIGDACIINSGAIIEHDNRIGKSVHVAPGSRTSGRVIIDDFAFIGVGSTIIPDIHIGQGALIGAGSTVVKNVEAKSTIMGYAARTHVKNIYMETDPDS